MPTLLELQTLRNMSYEELQAYYDQVNDQQRNRSDHDSNVEPGSLTALRYDEDEKIAVYDQCTVHAGIFDEIQQGEAPRYAPLIEIPNLHTGMPYSEVTISGVSMEPVLPDGATVVFSQTEQVLSGNIAVVRYKGEELIKYVLDDPEGRCYWLCSANPDYAPVCVMPGDDFAIYGPYRCHKMKAQRMPDHVFRAMIARYKSEHPERLTDSSAPTTNTPTTTSASAVPPELSTDNAKLLWSAAYDQGWVDEHLQLRISKARAAILASLMAEKLKLQQKWEPFEKLWNIRHLSSSLTKAQYRSYYPDEVRNMSNILNH